MAHLLAARQHFQQVTQRPHAADHLHLIQEVIEGQFPGEHFGSRGHSLLLINLGFGLFNQRQYVTHAEDTASHALWVEDIKVLKLLTRGSKLDRAASDLTDRQCRATAGVTIKLRQHHASEVDSIAERLRGGHSVLTNHRVDDKQDFIRVDGVANITRLRHQLLINAQTTCSIDDDDVVLGAAGFIDTTPSNLNGVAMGGAHHMIMTIESSARIWSEASNTCTLSNDL